MTGKAKPAHGAIRSMRTAASVAQQELADAAGEPHWHLLINQRARKDFRRLDPPTRDRIAHAIKLLAQNAELTGDVKRLKGSEQYRLRVAAYRVRFERDSRQLAITVVRVLPRGRAYDH